MNRFGFTPDVVREHPMLTGPYVKGTGEQVLFRFPNRYGASVIRYCVEYEIPGMTPKPPGMDVSISSYGGKEGLWELAVLVYHKGKKSTLTYSTPIARDVIGFLTDQEVHDVLSRISKLRRNRRSWKHEMHMERVRKARMDRAVKHIKEKTWLGKTERVS